MLHDLIEGKCSSEHPVPQGENKDSYFYPHGTVELELLRVAGWVMQSESHEIFSLLSLKSLSQEDGFVF
jgi:hypothetical protein